MKKILLIEDEPQIRQNIEKLLNIYGYSCTSACSGNEALKKIELDKPDVIVCDVMMDDLGGFEFIEIIKSTQSTATIPFIFLTARADAADAMKGIELGANAYLVKPIDIRELTQTIDCF
jgi:DNA-binding response OmpR family regulator